MVSHDLSHCPRDLTGGEWAVLKPLFPSPSHIGLPRKSPMRRIVDRFCYMLRAGLPWRMMPPGFPPASTVQRWFYAGGKLKQALARIGDWTIEIIKRSDRIKGFIILPRRWEVERTFPWLGRNRRLAKDFNHTIASACSWPFMASVQILARPIARP